MIVTYIDLPQRATACHCNPDIGCLSHACRVGVRPLDDRRHHHISDPMLEEDILCRLGGTVLTSTPSLLGLPLGIPPRRSQQENSKHPR